MTAPCTDGGCATIGVAIAVPSPWAEQLREARASFGDPLASSIPTHVTLLPPTELAAADLPDVERHLAEVAADFDSFTVHLRGTGTFRPVSPVVFVALAAGISQCEQLEARVRTGPLARETTFSYHPHVTVAHDVPEAALDAAFDQLADFEASFTVAEFWLYEHGADEVWRKRRRFAFPPAR
ncbi:MAG: 2'-5' RNA ligase family protein [Actinomycetes bacterium]